MSRLALAAAALLMVVGVARTASAEPCGNVTYTGCCVDDTNRQYCALRDSGYVLIKGTCTGGKICGWDATNKYYTCTTAATQEPTNTYPRLCSALPDGGPIPSPEKGIKGDKGPTVDKSTVVVPCGDITKAGCCEDDTTTKYCSSGSLVTKTCTGTQKCGWVKALSGYGCGTTTDADPAGVVPRSCTAQPKVDANTSKTDTGGVKPTYDTGAANPDKPKNPTPTKTDDGGCTIGSSSLGAAGLIVLLGAAILGLIARRRRR